MSATRALERVLISKSNQFGNPQLELPYSWFRHDLSVTQLKSSETCPPNNFRAFTTFHWDYLQKFLQLTLTKFGAGKPSSSRNCCASSCAAAMLVVVQTTSVNTKNVFCVRVVFAAVQKPPIAGWLPPIRGHSGWHFLFPVSVHSKQNLRTFF